MNIFKNLLACICAFCVISCQTDKSTTINKVEINKNGVSCEGKPYTGTVWSDDSSTYSLQVKDGSLISYTLYHPNGNPAITITTDSMSTLFYDESGNVLSLDSFVAKYNMLADEVTELAQRIENRSSSD